MLFTEDVWQRVADNEPLVKFRCGKAVFAIPNTGRKQDGKQIVGIKWSVLGKDGVVTIRKGWVETEFLQAEAGDEGDSPMPAVPQVSKLLGWLL